jgi:beta-xylosidase
VLLLIIISVSCAANEDTPKQVVPDSPAEQTINLADPTIFYHEGTYYLYGTVEQDASNGFLVYTSDDMKEWQGPNGAKEGYALSRDDTFGDKGFWAPQVFHENGKFYMAYTANENIAIAESNSPLGPFTQAEKKALVAPVKQIDPYVFIDEDGKKYLYHVRLTDGNKIFVAEMEDDFSAVKEETLTLVIAATDPWENTASAPWPVTEGPTVFKRDNLYYMLYSANDFRNPDYAVGLATSSTPLGPWVKHQASPILSSKELGIPGTGHGDLVTDSQNDLWYVFHTHYSPNAVAPRKTALVKASFKEGGAAETGLLTMDKESFYYLNKQQE